MNGNIQTLRAELDINEHHLLNISVLFHPPFKSGRTAPYLPSMVNHRLLEDGNLLALQPKGPIVNGKCTFETALEYAMLHTEYSSQRPGTLSASGREKFHYGLNA